MIDRLVQSAAKGAVWLLSQIADDGMVEPRDRGIDTYYKVPRALAAAGNTAEATALLERVIHADMTPNGDFEPAHRGRFHHDFYIYPHCWLILAAQQLNVHQPIEPATDFVDSFPRHDILTASFAGLVMLGAQRIACARTDGQFLLELIDMQPAPDRRLHAAADERFDQPGYIVQRDTPGQRYYFPGIASAFLAQLHEATGEPAWLDAARWYWNFWFNCGGDVLQSVRSGKGALGSAYLHRITGENQYREAALRIADYLQSLQAPNGQWHALDAAGDPAPSYTAEFVVWLHEIARCCGA